MHGSSSIARQLCRGKKALCQFTHAAMWKHEQQMPLGRIKVGVPFSTLNTFMFSGSKRFIKPEQVLVLRECSCMQARMAQHLR